MRLTNVAGEKMAKSVRVKVFSPDNKTSRVKVYRSQSGHGIDGAGVAKIVEAIYEGLGSEFPGFKYKAVMVAGGFNFISQGKVVDEIPV